MTIYQHLTSGRVSVVEVVVWGRGGDDRASSPSRARTARQDVRSCVRSHDRLDGLVII
jgi:hypothetical protein